MKIHAHELDEGGVFRGKAGLPPVADPAHLPTGVRVHEVDISEATSCSLATSCSSDLNQTSSDVLMMGGGEHNSQDFIGGGGGGGGGVGGVVNGGGPGGVAGVVLGGVLMDDEEMEHMTGVGDGEEVGGGMMGGAVEEGSVECMVCAKSFKNEMRLVKHQRQVHSGEFWIFNFFFSLFAILSIYFWFYKPRYIFIGNLDFS